MEKKKNRSPKEEDKKKSIPVVTINLRTCFTHYDKIMKMRYQPFPLALHNIRYYSLLLLQTNLTSMILTKKEFNTSCWLYNAKC